MNTTNSAQTGAQAGAQIDARDVATDLAAHDAFTRLYTEYGARAQSLALSRLKYNRESAEDITQQAFLQVWRKMQVEPIRPETEWAMIAHFVVNLCTDEWRHNDAQRRHLGDPIYLTPGEHFEDGDRGADGVRSEDRVAASGAQDGDPARLLMNLEALEGVLKACRTARQKQVALMWMMDYSQEEIAAEIGRSVGIVKTDLHRLRIRLGVKIAPRPTGRRRRTA